MGGVRVSRKGYIVILWVSALALRNVFPSFAFSLLGMASPWSSIRRSEDARSARVTAKALVEMSIDGVPPERMPIPDSTEMMCQQAADAVMAAYREGWTRQTVRLQTDMVFNNEELYTKGTGGLLDASMPLAKSFTQKLWNGGSFKAIKTSPLDIDAGTLLYREATNAAQDVAVLYLPSRDVVSDTKVRAFFTNMGDRLVVLSNTEQAPSCWKVENKGRDFYLVNDADIGAEIAETFRMQTYYLWQTPLNNWQVTYFRAYPNPWEIYFETLDLQTIKLGEWEEKPAYEVIIEKLEEYEISKGIKAYQKVGKILKDSQMQETDTKDPVAAWFDELKKMR